MENGEQAITDSDIRELRHDIDRVRERLTEHQQSVAETIGDMQRTPWGTIGAISAVVIAVILAFLGLIGSRFDSVNLRIDTLEKRDGEIIGAIDKTASDSVHRAELLATKEALNTEIQATIRHLDEVNSAIATINSDLIRRRSEFVEQVQLQALEKRIDEMLKALASRIDMRLTIAVFEVWKSERDRRFDQLEQRK